MQKVDLQLQDVKVQSSDGPIKVQPSKVAGKIVAAEKFSRAASKSCPQRCRQSPKQSWGDVSRLSL